MLWCFKRSVILIKCYFYLYSENQLFSILKKGIWIALCYHWWMHLVSFLLSFLFVFSNNTFDIVTCGCSTCSSVSVHVCKLVILMFVIFSSFVYIYDLWLMTERERNPQEAPVYCQYHVTCIAQSFVMLATFTAARPIPIFLLYMAVKFVS
jgi:hypothetical protein